MFREILRAFNPDITQGDFPNNVIANPDLDIEHIYLPTDKKTLGRLLDKVTEYIDDLSPADSAYKLDRAVALQARIKRDLEAI